MARKLFAIIGALMAGGLGAALALSGGAIVQVVLGAGVIFMGGGP